ncbi:MAG: Glu-tRNA(Gln) amidotransferase subunit GatE [Methanomassiliicoccaceae archaeon]|jgi:glutamyl-tRNA(Gln) amidotransferase subunit E|nr:Glu-tRNA(Gln) amidotransferase subunit GatE [Methanomassiliicoccaceae archaeon]
MSSGDRFICGIEIHQQLDTKKLFCSCDSELSEESTSTYLRRLRPMAGESGITDRAALAESKKQLSYRYQTPAKVSCLVELDEEPPNNVNEDALDVALTFAAMADATIFDEIYFMRKIVVDGSGPGGYQRTAMVAKDGRIKVNGKEIVIESVCLEEDSSRKIEEKDGEITYRLDRLSIPLIEIATGPDIRTPEEAMEVALRIGTMLRATKRVKRGIGTIREDINISLPGSRRTEIKGAQELRLLPTYVENEVQRHTMLLVIKDILAERKVCIDETMIDVTDIFKDCPSKVIRSALSDKGKVLAVRLHGFAGVLNGDSGRLRLGAEMAQRARTKGVKGIFHSDELPAYGIEEEYVSRTKEALSMKGEHDAFVLCAEREGKAKAALEAVTERAKEALTGVPEETRDPQPDGTSRYMRPLPGAARMYPETDIPPILMTEEKLKQIYNNLPELPENITKRLISKYGINAQQADQIVRQGNEDIFEKIAKDKALISAAAATFLGTFTEMEREGIDVNAISEKDILDIFSSLKAGNFAKEALPSLFREIAKGTPVSDAVSKLGVGAMSESEAAKIIAKIVTERENFVKEKGMGSVGPLMGPVMEALRGKLDGKKMNDLLTKEIKKLL